MRYATTVIIGAGQAGLAMSRQLSNRSIDHVVVERGRAGFPIFTIRATTRTAT